MKQLFFAFICMSSLSVQAQFIEPTDFNPSFVKDLTVIDTAGKSYTGEISKMKEKKQLVKEFTIKTKDGEKFEFTPDMVKVIYARASTVSRLSALNNATIARVEKNKLSKKKDTIVFEGVKDTDGDFILLQVVNPGYDSKIKVYANPTAGKTTSWTGFDGGLDRSFYVSKNGEPVFKLVKKDMKEKFALLFDDCASLKDKSKNWESFDNYIEEYDTCK